MRHLKCIIYLGAMYVEATRESLYIEFGGKMLLGKEKSCIYQGKDNIILYGLTYYLGR